MTNIMQKTSLVGLMFLFISSISQQAFSESLPIQDNMTSDDNIFYNCINSDGGMNKSEFNLLDYPGFFRDPYIVHTGTVASEMIVTELAESLGTDNIVLTTDSSDVMEHPFNYNLITIGSRCDNRVTKIVTGNSQDCNEGLRENVGYIRVFENNGFIQIVVESFVFNDDAILLNLAKHVLVNHEEYILHATVIEIRGTTPANMELKIDRKKLPVPGCFCLHEKCAAGPVCFDSDRKDYFRKGYAEMLRSRDIGTYVRSEDECISGIISEYFCEDDRVENTEFICPFGCADDRCISFENEIIIDRTDNVRSSSDCSKPVCRVISTGCDNSDKIIINECDISIKTGRSCSWVTASRLDRYSNACSLNLPDDCEGCLVDSDSCFSSGARFSKANQTYYCSPEYDIILQKDIGENCTNAFECITNHCKENICKPMCNGCVDEGICRPIGNRKDNDYCDTDFNLKVQKFVKEICSNDYECKGNVCENDECITLNSLQKMIRWIKNKF